MPLRPISYYTANSLLRRQVGYGAIALLEEHACRWYATVQREAVGCLLPADGSWRFVLLGWDGHGGYLKFAEGDGYESADAAYEAIAAERLKMLPPPA